MKRGDVLNLTNGVTVAGTGGLKARYTFEKGEGVAVFVMGEMKPDGSLPDPAQVLGELGWVRTDCGSKKQTCVLGERCESAEIEVKQAFGVLAAYGVPFVWKQWGSWLPENQWLPGAPGPDRFTRFGDLGLAALHFPRGAGRLLDGREHLDLPWAREMSP